MIKVILPGQGPAPGAAAVQRRRAGVRARPVELPPQAPAANPSRQGLQIILPDSIAMVATADDGRVAPFASDVKVGRLMKVHLLNFAMMVLSAGFFRFWARTRMRRHLWDGVVVMGGRLEYTGTARELLYGFLYIFLIILLPLFGIPLVLMPYLFVTAPGAEQYVHVAQFALIGYLIPVGMYRARRYQLTRTQWRSIACAQTGSGFVYGLIVVVGLIVNLLSLGLAYPWTERWSVGYKLRHTWIGNRALEFSAPLWPLYKPFLIVWALFVLPTLALGVLAFLGSEIEMKGDFDISNEKVLGLIVGLAILAALIAVLPKVWFDGRALSHFISHTRFMGAGLSCRITGFGYLGYRIVNYFIDTVTMGIAAPVVYGRVLEFYASHLDVDGEADPSHLNQSPFARPDVGEGLADAFDLGAV